MPNENVIDQARFILTTGKMIRDRVFRNITGHMGMNGNSEGCGFGELSLPQIHAVNVTRERGEVTVTELADMLGVSPPSASAMVDRLVEKGVFNREQSREDRRKVVVSVSSKAMEQYEVIEKNILQSFINLVEGIGPDTARKWCEVLERVKEVQEQGI
jgi:DNA-binding MarR family transcriptional regulator